jgi:mannosyltransferase OCH1-like enzyme
MIRLEALLRFGGVYVDQDVEPLRPMDPLLHLPAFAAWEDERCVPNAVMGASPEHPAIRACLDEMLRRIPGDTWKAGPGVLTDILPGRDDVLLLPPGSFYPYHYKEKERAGEDFRKSQPWAFVAHHWWGSWL